MVINCQRPKSWGIFWPGKRSQIDLFYMKSTILQKYGYIMNQNLNYLSGMLPEIIKTPHIRHPAALKTEIPLYTLICGAVLLTVYQSIVAVQPIQLSPHMSHFFLQFCCLEGFDSDKRGVHTPKHVAQYQYSRKQYVLPHSKQEPNNADSIVCAHTHMCTALTLLSPTPLTYSYESCNHS